MSVWLLIQNMFRGIVCGVIGGGVAGATFGFTSAILGSELFAWPVYTWGGTLVGGVVGGIIGGCTGFTLPITRPFLKRLCQIVGLITVTFIGFWFSLAAVEQGSWIPALLGIVTDIFIGILGGTVAFRSYIWLFER